MLSKESRKTFLISAARKSNFAFAQVVCGRDRLRDEHRDWELLTKNNFGCYLMPRDSLKTTFFAESYITKLILDLPEIRILLITDVYKPHARQRVQAVQKYLLSFEANEYCPGIHERIRYATVWNENEICIPVAVGSGETGEARWRTRDRVTGPPASAAKPRIVPRRPKESNLFACGIDSPQTGGHYDLILLDDVVNEKDKRSFTVREKKRELFPAFLDLMEEGTQLLIIGTRWHPEDLYDFVMKTPEYEERFTFYTQSVYNDDGTVWLEEFYTPEFLKMRKAQPIHFSHQYLNVAVAGEDRRVDLEWFKEAPYPGRDNFVLVTVGVDPAFSEGDEKRSCFKAAAVWGVDKKLNVWLLGGALTRDSLETFKTGQLRDIYNRHSPQFIRVENNGPQKGAELFFKTDKEYGKIVRGTDANMAVDKLARAQGWLAHAQTKGIYVAKGPWWEGAEYQLDYFPLGDYKDYPDAMSCAWPDVEKLLKPRVDRRPVQGRERVRLQI